MKQQKHRARGVFRAGRVGVVVLGLGAALAMTGCSAGQVAQTALAEPGVNGALGKQGKLAIRDAVLAYPQDSKGVYPKGSDAELRLTIINRGMTDDKLVRVSSKAAQEVTVEGSRVIPGNGTLVVGMPQGDSGASPTGSKASATAEPAGGTGPGSGSAQQRTRHLRVVLNDLTVPFRSGHTAEITFNFANAGAITVDMPIATPTRGTPPRERGDARHGQLGGGH